MGCDGDGRRRLLAVKRYRIAQLDFDDEISAIFLCAPVLGGQRAAASIDELLHLAAHRSAPIRLRPTSDQRADPVQ